MLMLVIIAHHYVVNSGLMGEITPGNMNVNSVFLILFGAWGKTGINCFLLITGYFMCKSQITWRKFLKLLFEVEFYKITFAVIFCAAGYMPFSASAFLKAILPVTQVTDNFTGCFLVFFLLIPFLNILIANMNQKQHLCLLALLLSVYTILPTLFRQVSFNYVTWFSVLYLLSAFIRLYPHKIFNETKIWALAFSACFALSSLSVAVLYALKRPDYYFFVSDSNKLPALATAVSLFLFFKNVKIPYSRFINTVASTVFGVFLIHANSDAMRQWLWGDLLKNTEMFGSAWLIGHAVCSVLGVFIICSLIDLLRIKFIETPLFSRLKV